VWNLVDNADPAEKQELVDAVRMLADPTGKGRAKLIEMYGARVEGGDGSVDCLPVCGLQPRRPRTLSTDYPLGPHVFQCDRFGCLYQRHLALTIDELPPPINSQGVAPASECRLP
jgi:hypothetical protein